MARPADVALGLAVHYGHRLERPVVYTQGVALSGRLRLHELLPDSPDPAPDIAEIVAPYVADPEFLVSTTGQPTSQASAGPMSLPI